MSFYIFFDRCLYTHSQKCINFSYTVIVRPSIIMKGCRMKVTKNDLLWIINFTKNLCKFEKYAEHWCKYMYNNIYYKL